MNRPSETGFKTSLLEQANGPGRNDCDNPTMGEIIARRFSRRQVLRGSLAVSAIATTVAPAALLSAPRASAQTPASATCPLDDRLCYVMTFVKNVITLRMYAVRAVLKEELAGGGATRRQRGRNQHLVLQALHHADRPLGAYELLRLLQDEGLRSPLQIYRALDRLIAEGRVHKIESVSAYAPCSHSQCGHDGHAIFAVCTRCGQATETRDALLDRLLVKMAQKQRFRWSAPQRVDRSD